ncbi:hypothetical protein X793_00375 [Dehalococcoides mccartyi CG4]|uniref:hypothetical protein n=1 Tax=Dehalococcoides mccartyi TaxID=61435 RepID=UPI0004E08486|nr:hypothetical protein [Dehalococcoides mccartyi]AII60150.1 hypothetical protein X793_00375 [Dehalococcoides mccartyi CG4]
MTKQHSIRFGISDGNGRRACTWKCWTHIGSGKSDVYIICRSLDSSVKVSLHDSGNWRVAFSQEFYHEQSDIFAENPKGRCLSVWEPIEISPGVILAFHIVTPYSSITNPIGKNDNNVIWALQKPKYTASEIFIVLTSSDAVVSSWPGKNSMGTSLLGSFQLENKSKMWIVEKPVICPNFKIPQGRLTYFKNMHKENISGDNIRAFIIGKEKDGSRYIVDAVVDVKIHTQNITMQDDKD